MSLSDYRTRLKYIIEDRPVRPKSTPIPVTWSGNIQACAKEEYTPHKYHNVEFDDYTGFIKCVNKLTMYNSGNYPYYPNTYISLQIHDPISSEPLYIPMFDCDNEKDRAIISYHLKHVDKRSYFTMISSPKKEDKTIMEEPQEHSWIFIDHIGTINEVLTYMNSIHAGDFRYKQIAEKRKILVVRAYPKGIFIPKQVIEWGEISTNNKRVLGTFNYSEQFSQWVNDFLDYWDSNLIKDIITNNFVDAL